MASMISSKPGSRTEHMRMRIPCVQCVLFSNYSVLPGCRIYFEKIPTHQLVYLSANATNAPAHEACLEQVQS